MEVKVQCSCGTRYKFDVEPINNLMPGPVACPTCGADGTAASNAIIQHALNAQPQAFISEVGQTSPAEKPRIRLQIPSANAVSSAPAAAPMAQQATPESGAPLSSGGTPSLAVPLARERPPVRTVYTLPQPTAEAARAKGNFGFGILGAVLGTLLSVGLWLGIFYATESGSRSVLKLFAIGVGLTAGFGARLLSRDEGSKELGSITAAIAFLGIFGAQYLIAKEQIIGNYKKVVSQVYEARVEYAKKAVKSIPTGSDQEIREFLAKESADEGEKMKPAEIEGDEVQEFRDKELPELRDLASGKTTKAQYDKESGVNELEENSGIKLLLAIKGLGVFTIGAMILALGAAYKIAASNA
jgi:hypothetical protein